MYPWLVIRLVAGVGGWYDMGLPGGLEGVMLYHLLMIPTDTCIYVYNSIELYVLDDFVIL